MPQAPLPSLSSMSQSFSDWLAKKENLRFLILLLFFSFFILRGFVQYPYIEISADEANYLALAQDFPTNHLHNNSLYLIHPPLYSYMLHFFSLFFEDHIAGLTISFLASLLSFFFLYRILSLFVKEWAIISFTLLLYTLSVYHLFFSQLIYKESLMILLFLSTIYFFLLGLLQKKSWLFVSCITGIATSMTTDYIIFLIPTLFCALLIFRTKKSTILYPLIVIILITCSYSSWIFMRYSYYTHNEYYPLGDGLVEKTSSFGFNELITPYYFPEARSSTNFNPSDLKHYVYLFGLMFNILPIYIPLEINLTLLASFITSPLFILKVLVYIVLFIFFCYGIAKTIVTPFAKKTFHSDHNLFFLITLILFLYPIMNQVSTVRRLLFSVIFLYYFISLGFFNIFPKKSATFSACCIILLALSMPFWMHSHPHPYMFQKKIVEGEQVAPFINSLPKDGIMSQVGYTPEMNYFTNKRVISLPVNASSLPFLIQRYNISYVLYGERYWEPISSTNRQFVLNYDSIDYILDHSQNFRLIGIFSVDLRNRSDVRIGLSKQDTIYVYEVLNISSR